LKKHTLIVLPLLLVFIVQFLLTSPAPVAADDGTKEPDANNGICLPQPDSLISNGDCLMEGPAKHLQDLTQVGFNLPLNPIYVTQPPADLGKVPFSYAKVIDDVVPLYGSIEDVNAQKPNQKLPLGRIKYVSLYDKAETDFGLYYKIANGKWISRENITPVGTQFFQGFLFTENPTTSFGWILDTTESYTEPSYNAPSTGREYHRYDIVRAYDSITDGNTEWIMIGPNEWISHRSLSRFIPNYEKPEGVPSDRWIEVNLYEQVLTVHENGRILFTTLVATGVDPFFTQPGVFPIYKKIENEYMRGAFEADRSDYYYLEDVPYIMYFDQARALHGAYWHTLFGYQRSHGCVNLSIADSHWLYDWANLGDYVYVWDPSGKTPTDPAFYGAGGA